MIISGGFNVYCAEVEAAVMELPEIRECAVIGVPDDKWGEAVKAIVVLRDRETISEDLIIAHCKTRLGGVKARSPLNSAQKFRKQRQQKQIRKRFASRIGPKPSEA
jgi:acyl-CoA synthetase (AMP-forming)/AMP-acid ligase II